MSKIGRANEQNRQKLEELQQRKIGSFWSIIGSSLLSIKLYKKFSYNPHVAHADLR